MPAVANRGWRLPEGIAPSDEHVEQTNFMTQWMDMMATSGQTYCETYEAVTEKMDAVLAVPLAPPKPAIRGTFTVSFAFNGRTNDPAVNRQAIRSKLEGIQYNTGSDATPMAEQHAKAAEYLESIGFEVVPQGLYRYTVDETQRRRFRDNYAYRSQGQEQYLRF